MTERLQPGDTAPAFSLSDADGNQVSLADHLGRKVIVYFYPAALTPGCTKQACDFTDNLEVFAGAGYDVIGISPDKPEKLGKFREAEDLKVVLLSDPDHAVLEAYAAYGEKQNYGRTYQGVIRSTVIVDEQGKVERALYNVKATGHVAKLLRDLKVETA
ncbi:MULTISPECIES: thioredoxin-dependent thiol peroxidase [Streptomycetaceae]|uniref:thioredoxin-dependent thiol peroxidase n=1 Tax=Streptomycetaceae TaxID=2062 RepID=UPI000CDBB00D|nr:thioredoxin-dependent thiol peroxidase [Streptomyces sp. CB01881]AUY51611.1 thioredoxin-dependent thiol peroxidase [Streptomyces sp. CB01881]TYC75002.1 thioredoxin-dependent thiol peroxidase [Streptomyces sp. CB01881]